MSDDRPCAEWLDRLDLSADELGPAEARELAGHLGSCSACRREHERGQAFRAALLAGDPATELRPDRSRAMRAALLERCETEARQPPAQRPWWPSLLRWAALPAAAALSLGIWALVHRPHEGQTGPITSHPLTVRARPPAPVGDNVHPEPRAGGDTHWKPRAPAGEPRITTGPLHRDRRSAVQSATERPHVRRTVPPPRLASHAVRRRSTPRIAREILVLEASADRGTAVEPPPPVRIAMGSGNSRSGQIAMGIAPRRP